LINKRAIANISRTSAHTVTGHAAGPAAVVSAAAVLTEGVSNVMLKYVALLACGGLVLAALHLPGNGCPGARLLALAGVEVGCAPTSADEKKDDKDKSPLSGTWTRAGGEAKIEFADKGVLKLMPHGDKEVVVIVCSYTAGKGGLVKAKITDIEGKAKDKVKEHLPVGLAFSFKWQVKDATATLDDVKGDDLPEKVKEHLEGKYEQKK
jgi:hypothetical protein